MLAGFHNFCSNSWNSISKDEEIGLGGELNRKKIVVHAVMCNNEDIKESPALQRTKWVSFLLSTVSKWPSSLQENAHRNESKVFEEDMHRSCKSGQRNPSGIYRTKRRGNTLELLNGRAEDAFRRNVVYQGSGRPFNPVGSRIEAICEQNNL